MRKVMLMAAMLAMVLVAAAPAFAQATGGDVNIQAVDCSQVAVVAAAQGQYGDADADAGDVASAASADVANELGVSVEQVNACVEGVAAGGDIVVEDDDDVAVHKDDMDHKDNGAMHEDSGTSGGSSSSGSAAAGAAAAGAAAAGGTLPDTGGASLIALGAGALLVAGGLVARRIVR